MEGLAADNEKKAAVLEALAALYPWMVPFYPRPVRHYASRLYAPLASQAIPPCRSHALQKLLALMHKAAKRNGLPDGIATKICRDFQRRRVLQTGPHLLLLLDPEAFYTHIFSLLGLSAHGSPAYVSYSVSTMSLVERTRKGPGWLTVDGKAINIFGLSRSRMVGYSLLTELGPYRFELTPAEPDGEGETLARLRDLLPKRRFEKPAQALKAANLSLWPQLFGDHFAFLQLDDEDVADLMVDHLSDGVSWVRTRLFENPRLVSILLEVTDQLAASPWAGWFTRGTDFFWSYENGKRVPLRLEGQELVHQASGAKVSHFAPDDIVARLLNRSLIPNMFLAFLLLAILPGVRVLGGSHQPIYYPLMRYVVGRALKIAGLDAELCQALAIDDLPGAWGHRVIERSGAPFDLFGSLGRGASSALLKDCGDLSLIEACGNMHSFVHDAAWSELQLRLAGRVVAATDAEWSFS